MGGMLVVVFIDCPRVVVDKACETHVKQYACYCHSRWHASSDFSIYTRKFLPSLFLLCSKQYLYPTSLPSPPSFSSLRTVLPNHPRILNHFHSSLPSIPKMYRLLILSVLFTLFVGTLSVEVEAQEKVDIHDILEKVPDRQFDPDMCPCKCRSRNNAFVVRTKCSRCQRKALCRMMRCTRNNGKPGVQCCNRNRIPRCPSGCVSKNQAEFLCNKCKFQFSGCAVMPCTRSNGNPGFTCSEELVTSTPMP